MARRAFIGANRRTDGIRRKPGRAEVAQGARSRSTGLSVQDNSFTPIRVDIATPNPGPGGIGRRRSGWPGHMGHGAPALSQEAACQEGLHGIEKKVKK